MLRNLDCVKILFHFQSVEYLEKANKKEQPPLPQPLAGQPQPDFVVQQQQQQRRKQDFVFYE